MTSNHDIIRAQGSGLEILDADHDHHNVIANTTNGHRAWKPCCGIGQFDEKTSHIHD
jgi:hypothetical protein